MSDGNLAMANFITDTPSEVQELLAENEKLESELAAVKDQLREAVEVNDMQAAMIEGMRRVVAIARLVNSDREDIRLALAIRDYDKCKIVTASGSGNGKIAPVKQ